MGRRVEIGIDCNDEARLKAFWREALSLEEVPMGEGTELHDPDGGGQVVWFQVVPEVKTAKNRLHLDIWLPRAEADELRPRLLALGGSVLREAADYTVLADPEGNELCLCWGHAGDGVPG